MELTNSIEDILRQLNRALDPEHQVDEREITGVGARLNHLLAYAAQPATASAEAPHASRPTLRARLAMLWHAIKDKLAAWLSPLTPKWRKLLALLKAKLFENNTGKERLWPFLLTLMVVIFIAAVLKSLPMLIAFLAFFGLLSLVQLLRSLCPSPAFV
jgi:hypothetical protein